jgi:predicted O-methyltransferase YrrM
MAEKIRRYFRMAGIEFKCPGCHFWHHLPCEGFFNTGVPEWKFNSDSEYPTLEPSIRMICGELVCHSYVINGKIQFLADCTHELRGQTVDLPNIRKSRDFGFNETEIPTWTEPETLKYLAALASKSTYAVESGTYMGASARAMLEQSAVHLWCVDLFPVFGTEQVTKAFLQDWIADGRCEIIKGDMDKAGEMLAHMRGKIDLCWIDDGHAEEDLRRDIRNCLPLLRPGGLMIGHDFDVPHNDVARGVLSMIPREQLTFPKPRLWQFQKP